MFLFINLDPITCLLTGHSGPFPVMHQAWQLPQLLLINCSGCLRWLARSGLLEVSVTHVLQTSDADKDKLERDLTGVHRTQTTSDQICAGSRTHLTNLQKTIWKHCNSKTKICKIET